MKVINNLVDSINHYFFVGVAGVGISAIAQYLVGIGKTVSGSDRQFPEKIRQQLQNETIHCFPQDGSGITSQTQLVVVSTAIEEQNIEIQKAKALNIPIVRRAELLKAITDTRRTIAIAGTSGKSTTVAMLFHILQENQYSPSLISGAGLIALEQENKIGNAFVGKGEWLLIEADESDGTLVHYTPEVGIILNIDKDHKELQELETIFQTFKNNITNHLIVNGSHQRTARFSQNKAYDFGLDSDLGFYGYQYQSQGFKSSFKVQSTTFKLSAMGKHNMENALAAIAAANYVGISLDNCAKALSTYQGIHRRMQIVGEKNGLIVIDDYAHNPAKIAAALRACQPLCQHLIAWFQPHGFAPTRFLRTEFVKEISQNLRENDWICMSEIYYAGGTVTKDISANDLIVDLQNLNKNAFFIENRNDFPAFIQSHSTTQTLILLMGARDASLDNFAKFVFDKL